MTGGRVFAPMGLPFRRGSAVVVIKWLSLVHDNRINRTESFPGQSGIGFSSTGLQAQFENTETQDADIKSLDTTYSGYHAAGTCQAWARNTNNRRLTLNGFRCEKMVNVAVDFTTNFHKVDSLQSMEKHTFSARMNFNLS